MKTEDRRTHGADGFLGLVGDLERVLFLEGVDLLQLAGLRRSLARLRLRLQAAEGVGGLEDVHREVSLHRHGIIDGKIMGKAAKWREAQKGPR